MYHMEYQLKEKSTYKQIYHPNKFDHTIFGDSICIHNICLFIKPHTNLTSFSKFQLFINY